MDGGRSQIVRHLHAQLKESAQAKKEFLVAELELSEFYERVRFEESWELQFRMLKQSEELGKTEIRQSKDVPMPHKHLAAIQIQRMVRGLLARRRVSRLLKTRMQQPATFFQGMLHWLDIHNAKAPPETAADTHTNSMTYAEKIYYPGGSRPTTGLGSRPGSSALRRPGSAARRPPAATTETTIRRPSSSGRNRISLNAINNTTPFGAGGGMDDGHHQDNDSSSPHYQYQYQYQYPPQTQQQQTKTTRMPSGSELFKAPPLPNMAPPAASAAAGPRSKNKYPKPPIAPPTASAGYFQNMKTWLDTKHQQHQFGAADTSSTQQHHHYHPHQKKNNFDVGPAASTVGGTNFKYVYPDLRQQQQYLPPGGDGEQQYAAPMIAPGSPQAVLASKVSAMHSWPTAPPADYQWPHAEPPSDPTNPHWRVVDISQVPIGPEVAL